MRTRHPLRPRGIAYPLIALSIALVWGVIETLALWRARSSDRSSVRTAPRLPQT